VNLIWIVVLALFGLLLFRVGSQTLTGSSQECTATATGVERCGPEINDDGTFKLPDDEIVIRAVVNNGPVAPDSQEGYEVQIAADGSVVVTETIASDGSGEDSERVVTSSSIGGDGVQNLLQDLNSCGIFFLPQRAEFSDADLPDGGRTSLISIHLADGEWEVLDAFLDGTDTFQFESCQQIIANEFDLEPAA